MTAPPLLGYLTSLCRDRSQAHDLLQDAFLQIHRSRHTYRPGLPVRPWLFAIARHMWLMDRRTRVRRPVATGELPVATGGLPFATGELSFATDRQLGQQSLGSP